MPKDNVPTLESAGDKMVYSKMKRRQFLKICGLIPFGGSLCSVGDSVASEDKLDDWTFVVVPYDGRGNSDNLTIYYYDANSDSYKTIMK